MGILNRGYEPTLCSGFRQEVIDITLGSYGLLENITGWEVSLEPSLSDHRHILFAVQGSVPIPQIRKLRGTNWGSFLEVLKENLDRGPEMNMKDVAGLRLAVHWIQQTLISAYEDNCPLRPMRRGRKSIMWTLELESLRREVKRLFNKCRANNERYSWKLYREAQGRYRRRYERLPKRLGGVSVAL